MRADGSVCIPEIVAGEVDVLPSERGDMGEQRIRHRLAAATRGIQRPGWDRRAFAGLVGRRNPAIEGGALSQLDSPRWATRKLLFRLAPEPEQTDLTSTGTLSGASWG